jgi:hypothetical protein
MMIIRRFFYFTLIFSTFFTAAASAQQAPMLFEKEKPKPQIHIHNRVLAKVNQKPITVLDVVKKMDMVFYQQYPQYTDFPEIRCQFYMVSWKKILEEMVDKELILADAAEVKMEVGGADIRQELEELFGPNIIANLDKAGLSMAEAMKIVEEEIILRRMMYVRVQSRAIKDVTPQEIRLAYDRYVRDYKGEDEWRYRIITVRDPDQERLGRIARRISEKLRVEPVEVEDFASWAKNVDEVNLFTSIKVSDLYEQNDEDLSPKYKEFLSRLSPGDYSPPQKQNKDNAVIYKIYYLDNFVADQPPKFHEMASKLKSELMGKIIEEENIAYKKRLRRQFPVTLIDSLISQNFEPFTLEVDGKKIDVPLPNS